MCAFGWVVCLVVLGLPLWCYLLTVGAFDWIFTLAENLPDWTRNAQDAIVDKLCRVYEKHLRQTGQI